MLKLFANIPKVFGRNFIYSYYIIFFVKGDKIMLGKNIYKLRKKKGLSQEDLAFEINVTRQTISNWELGSTSPNPEQLKLLSRVLDVSVDELIDNDLYINNIVKKSYGYEFISKFKIRGLPLFHINLGLGHSIRKAKGIIAIGDISKGVIALGGIAIGVFTLGGISLGLVAAGVLALAILFSTGGVAIGSVAIGGVAIGLLSIGGLSIGLYSIGGVAIAKNVAAGDYAYGHIAVGNYVEGTIELIKSEVSSVEIEKTILKQFPKTFKIIARIISNVTF